MTMFQFTVMVICVHANVSNDSPGWLVDIDEFNFSSWMNFVNTPWHFITNTLNDIYRNEN